MRTALRVDDYLPRLSEEDRLFPPAGSVVAEPMAIPYGERDVAAAIRRAWREDLERFGQKVAFVESGCARLLREVERSLSQGEAVDLDSLVEGLEVVEEQYREVLLPDVEHAERVVPRDQYDGAIELLHRALEVPRDCRWQLLALRAQGDEVGDAPVFDDPEGLGRYLESA